jgi:hypothetical protein
MTPSSARSYAGPVRVLGELQVPRRNSPDALAPRRLSTTNIRLANSTKHEERRLERRHTYRGTGPIRIRTHAAKRFAVRSPLLTQFGRSRIRRAGTMEDRQNANEESQKHGAQPGRVVDGSPADVGVQRHPPGSLPRNFQRGNVRQRQEHGRDQRFRGRRRIPRRSPNIERERPRRVLGRRRGRRGRVVVVGETSKTSLPSTSIPLESFHSWREKT